MGGRGRGRGRSSRAELGDKIGIDASNVFLSLSKGVPELFPPLPFGPAEICDDDNGDISYLLPVAKAFRESLNHSEYNIELGVKKTNELMPYDYQMMAPKKRELVVDLSRIPIELKPKTVGKKRKVSLRKKKVNFNEVIGKFDELQKKENSQEDSAEEIEDEEEEIRVLEDEDDPDEEMDAGTDYANTYFDNGEDYMEADEDDGGGY